MNKMYETSGITGLEFTEKSTCVEQLDQLLSTFLCGRPLIVLQITCKHMQLSKQTHVID